MDQIKQKPKLIFQIEKFMSCFFYLIWYVFLPSRIGHNTLSLFSKTNIIFPKKLGWKITKNTKNNFKNNMRIMLKKKIEFFPAKMSITCAKRARKKKKIENILHCRVAYDAYRGHELETNIVYGEWWAHLGLRRQQGKTNRICWVRRFSHRIFKRKWRRRR